MKTTTKIDVKGTFVNILRKEHADFVSLTDIARRKDPEHTDTIIQN